MSPRQKSDSTVSPSTPTTRSGASLSRRAVIASGGTAALVSLAGCSTIMNRLAEMALEEVNVFNGADRRVSGTIEIVDPNGEVVLEETFDLDAESQGGEDETNEAATAQYSDVWTDAGDYEATIELEEPLADGSGTAGNETEAGTESADNSSDVDPESADNSTDVETTNSSDPETSADNESGDNSSDSGTDTGGSEPGSSATETVTVTAPDEDHLVVGIDQDGTDESISFHVIEEFSELGEEFE